MCVCVCVCVRARARVRVCARVYICVCIHLQCDNLRPDIVETDLLTVVQVILLLFHDVK